MMNRLVLCCALLLLAPRLAAAEWHLTPMAGITFHGNTSAVDLERATGNIHPQIGGAATILGGGLFGIEAVAVGTRGFFQNGGQLVKSSHSFAVMGNAVLTAPRRWTEYSLRPLVSGGIGLMHASVSDVNPVSPAQANLLGFDIDLLGFNVGGGAIGFITPRTGVRFDLRYYSNLRRTDQGPVAFGRVHLSYLTASIGIVFRHK
jgi:hypothetical protein